MELYSNEYFKKLANDIMFDISDDEALQLRDEFKDLLNQIDILNEIDTEGVEEMIYPFALETSFLRDDVVTHVLTQEEALSNAKSVKAGHVHVPKVVK